MKTIVQSLNEQKIMDNPQVKVDLNTAIGDESQAVNQYQYFAQICKFKNYNGLYKIFGHLAEEEMEHIGEFSQRLLFLGGDPVINPTLPNVQLSHTDIAGMLNKVIELETKAIDDYNQFSRNAFDVNDNVTRGLFEHMVKDEEEHIDFVQNELEKLEEMGIQNYIVYQNNEQYETFI